MAQRSARQMSVDELRTQISQRLRSNAAFSKTVYQEQPIIMTGTQLKSFVPDAIREARQLARSHYAQGASTTEVFYEQARMLAGFEDDFDFAGSFSHYYPTYEDMSNEQLRGYFTWRTQVRRGAVKQGQLSFAYLYLYELINLVGVADALDGYRAMLDFGTAYRQFDATFGKTFDRWLDDFVIYYGLDATLLRTHSFATRDVAFDVLLHREDRTQDELFDALVTLGDHDIEGSPFCLEHEAELRRLVAHTYEVAAHHHETKLKQTLPEKLAGRLEKERFWPFERAVFANPLAIETASLVISPHDTVFCRNGAWFRVRHPKLEAPLPWVTQLLETCECILRDAYQYPNTLEVTLTTKYLVKAAKTLARQMADEAREREARAVHFDFGKLDHIRQAASETCEKLIVDDDESLGASGAGAALQAARGTRETRPLQKGTPASGASGAGAALQAARTAQHIPSGPDEIRPLQKDNSPLDSTESAFLALLLDGGDLRAFEREHACIASVLVDSINDKLYDTFADICIDASSGEPIIIEDYRQDLQSIV
ncbi:MAG TPA: TerB N-terminal domain-containing protein [Coriobacteriaceae bacterium]|nr:TerB N-terminal domain-containing protein [Coriobacteriaceae bacterium]